MNKLIYTLRVNIAFLFLLGCILYVSDTVSMSETVKGVYLVVVPLMITCIGGLLVEQTTHKVIGKWGIFYGTLLFLINLYDTIQSLC